MPSVHEFFHSFDSEAYARRIELLSDEELESAMQKKIREGTSASLGVGFGIGAALPTFGASLIGSAYSGRNCYIVGKKLELLKFEWNSRYWLGEFRARKRDTIIPCVIGVVTLGVGFEVGSVVTHAGSQIFDKVASTGAHHVISNVATLAHHVTGDTTNNLPPVDLQAQASAGGHGFVHGVEQTFEVLTRTWQLKGIWLYRRLSADTESSRANLGGREEPRRWSADRSIGRFLEIYASQPILKGEDIAV
ncbi:hypothetical protein FRB95_004118 [Tulasnella sp. JGI-2019a]|nr:hypothetical protein FRB95_004118 [Tulasnella sp. JGI-2019a]